VCAAMNAASVQPSHSIRCSIPWKSSTSLPGWIARCRSAPSRGRGAARVDDDDAHLRSLRARLLEAAEQHRVRPRRIAAGDEDASGVVEVLVAARRRVGAERLPVARHRAAHAQARIAVDVRRASTPRASLLKT
jgi:hypothetical protein